MRDLNVIPIPKSCTYHFRNDFIFCHDIFEMTLISSWMTRCDPQLRNGLESPDYDEMLAAYLTLVDNHCLNLIPVPASDTVPAIPSHIDNRAVYNSWAGEYVIDYEAWVNNFPKSIICNFSEEGRVRSP